jgi:hypothetical protein
MWHCIHFVFIQRHIQQLRLCDIDLYDELMNAKLQRMPQSDLMYLRQP